MAKNELVNNLGIAKSGTKVGGDSNGFATEFSEESLSKESGTSNSIIERLGLDWMPKSSNA